MLSIVGGGGWNFGGAEKICYLGHGVLDPQGRHTFGKYLILFMIIYMMVKLALVLRFLRIEKVLKCCVNFALWLSSYMIFCLEFHFQLKVNFWLLIQVILCFAGKVTLTVCMFYTSNSCMIFTLCVFNTL